MKNNKDTVCVNALNGLRVYNDGTAMFCCMSREILTNRSNNIANITVDKFDDIINGTKAIEIKNDLLNGIRHSNCTRCWDEEDSGLTSKRMRDNKSFPIENFKENELKLVELNLGTTCNLKCRICSPWSSSQWNKEYLQLKKWTGDMNNYSQLLYKLNHSYDDDSLFWSELKNNLNVIQQIDIYGGEPFLVKKQWELLKYSVEQGFSKDQTLHFNTNGTQFDIEKINIMKQFKDVTIDISIDGVEKQFEYQRHPAKWSEVVSNVKEFQHYAGQYNWGLSACVTVNNYNIFNLDYTLEYLFNIGIIPYVNFLHDPAHYNIKHLRRDLKKIVTEKFVNAEVSFHTRDCLNKVLGFMNSSEAHSSHWLSFQEIATKLDSIRQENFEEVFPEYYAAITKKNETWNIDKLGYLHIELSNHCNAACPMCPRFINHSNIIDPSLHLDEITIEKFKNYFPPELLKDIKRITFCGTHGEPMMARDVIQIVEYVKRYNSQNMIIFNTNGGVRNIDFWSKLGTVLKDTPHMVMFGIDGLEDTNHIYRRQVKWSHLMKNVKAFINAGGVAEWDFLIFKHNEHQLEEAEKLSKEIGFVRFNPKRALGFNTATGGKLKPCEVYDRTGRFEYWLEPPTDNHFINGVGPLIAGHKDDIFNVEQIVHYRETTINLNNLDEQYHEYLDKKIECKFLNRTLFSEIYVNANGHILPCCFIGSTVTGNYAVAHEVQLRKIYENNKDRLDLNIHSIFDIINDGVLNELFATKWELKSFDKGTPVFCSMICGSNNSIDKIYINPKE